MGEHTISAAASLETYRANTTVRVYDSETASGVLRGRIAANVVALSKLDGHLAVLNYVNKLLSLYVVPSDEPKIRLAVSNTAEVIR